MITRAEFRNFKTLKNADVDLGALTFLVGPNGCGKTSVLQGLDIVCGLRNAVPGEGRRTTHRPGMVFDAAGGAARLCTNGSEGPISLFVKSDGAAVRMNALREAPEDDAAQYVVSVDDQQTPQASNKRSGFFDGPVRSALPPAIRLSLDARLLALPSEASTAGTHIGPNGEDLPSVLNFLAGAHRERLEAIEADLASVVPGARRIRTFPVLTTVYRDFTHTLDGQQVSVPRQVQVPGHRFALELDGRGTVDADLLSEGTLLALGLLASLHHPDAPRLFLLDDIDRALHLGAQVRLVRILRAFQARHPDVQIVATTHSPFLLQEVAGEDIRVLALDAQGATRCRVLASHPDYAKWRAVMTPGEIWANLGEDWVGHDS